MLLTGGRETEVLGVEVDDVSLDRGVVTFRPNEWRRLKTASSHRSVPLWPQLRDALQRYLAERPPSRLLFPSFRTGKEAMLTDFRKLLDAVAMRAGWEEGDIRSKMFHTTAPLGYRRSMLGRRSARTGSHGKWVTAASPWSAGSTDTLDKSGIAPRRWSTVSNNTLLS